jgi:hypothetical protein
VPAARLRRTGRTALVAGGAVLAALVAVGGGVYAFTERPADVAAADPEPGGGADPAVPDADASAADKDRDEDGESPSPSAEPEEDGAPDEERVNDTPGEPVADRSPIVPAGGYQSGSATLDGTTYGESLRVTGDCAKPTAEYNLARGAGRLTTTVGVTGGGSATFTVTGDGTRLAAETVAAGDSADIEVPVDGVLRLRLTVDWNGSCPDGAVAVWGDPKLT